MAVGFRAYRRLISESVEPRLRRGVARLRGQQDRSHLISLGLKVGQGAFIATNAYLDPGYPWLIKIGDEATLGPHVIVLAHDASMQRHLRCTLLARVSIGKRAFIGAGAIILPGSHVGENAIVGAGTVVRVTSRPARSPSATLRRSFRTLPLWLRSTGTRRGKPRGGRSTAGRLCTASRARGWERSVTHWRPGNAGIWRYVLARAQTRWKRDILLVRHALHPWVFAYCYHLPSVSA